MKITINKYSDAGHGWFSVPVSVVKKFQLDLDSFRYLVCNKKVTRLLFEEDGEFSLIKKQLADKGVTVKVKNSYSRKTSKIRNYPIVEVNHLKAMRDFV